MPRSGMPIHGNFFSCDNLWINELRQLYYTDEILSSFRFFAFDNTFNL